MSRYSTTMSSIPNPVVRGNFVWKNGEQDTEVLFDPDPKR